MLNNLLNGVPLAARRDMWYSGARQNSITLLETSQIDLTTTNLNPYGFCVRTHEAIGVRVSG